MTVHPIITAAVRRAEIQATRPPPWSPQFQTWRQMKQAHEELYFDLVEQIDPPLVHNTVSEVRPRRYPRRPW